MQPITTLFTFLLCALLFLNRCNSAEQENTESTPTFIAFSADSAQLGNHALASVAQNFSSQERQRVNPERQVQVASSLPQLGSTSSVAMSIYAQHESILESKPDNRWQPWRIHSLREKFEYEDRQHLANFNTLNWDTGRKYTAVDPSSSRKISMIPRQLKQPGEWETLVIDGPTTSVGVQFVCDERCGWAQIEVDNVVRWVGDADGLTDYVEIYPLNNDDHTVRVTALGHRDGDASRGEVHILAIGEGKLHRLYLPFIQSVLSFQCAKEGAPETVYQKECNSQDPLHSSSTQGGQ